METGSTEGPPPGQQQSIDMVAIQRGYEELQAHVAQLQRENQALRNQQQTNVLARPRHTQQHLPEFDGTKKDWPVWKLKAREKIEVDAAAIGNERQQFIYLARALTGTAAQNMLSFCTRAANAGPSQAGSGQSYHWTALLENLEALYGNRLAEQQALDRLTTIKQGSRKIGSYVIDFERQLAEANGWDLADSMKRTLFYNGLKDDVKRTLLPVELPLAFSDYKNQVVVVAQRMEDLNNQRKGYQPSSHTDRRSRSPQNGAKASGPEPMDWETTRVNRAGGRPRASPITAEQHRARGRARVCYRCGNQGHFQATCQYLPAEVTKVQRVMVEPEQMLPEESDEDSGKE